MTTHSAPPSRIYVVIPCAGVGSRARTSYPKQYQRLVKLPVVIHTLQAFANVPCIAQGILVLSPDDTQMAGILREHPQPLFQAIYQGGATRAATVQAGVRHAIQMGAWPTDWVLVHDAARCLITSSQIKSLISACEKDEVGGLLAHKLADTLKAEVHGRVSQTVDRTDKWLAQTPQMFRLGTLLKALEQAGEHVTDESSAVESLGLSPLLVQGSAHNLKVTYPEDFVLAEAILKLRTQEQI